MTQAAGVEPELRRAPLVLSRWRPSGDERAVLVSNWYIARSIRQTPEFKALALRGHSRGRRRVVRNPRPDPKYPDSSQA